MFFRSKSISSLTNYSLDLYNQGHYAKARKICLQILRQDPKNYTAYVNLGNIYFVEQNYNDAITAYQHADSLHRDYYLAKINLANAYLESNQYNLAIDYARQALTLDSQSFMGYNIWGCASLELDLAQEAVSAFLQALKLDAKDAWIYNYLSQAYQKNNNIINALESGWQALCLAPQEDAHHINFGYLIYEASIDKFQEEAQTYARRWLQYFPTNKIACHMGNAVVHNSAVSSVNPEYLKNIFDVFAEDFEQVLADLEYHTPECIGRLLTTVYGEKTHPKLTILDAGCGTGLCGKYLKKYAKFRGLSGVDLSPQMLKQARLKKLYSHLFCDDLVHFLSLHKSSFDLIVSADVFTYFGDLDSLLANVAKSLKKNGRIIFSVSENTTNQDDYFLHISGRFLHRISYVKNLLQHYNLQAEKLEKTILRKEGEQDVWGYVIVAKK